jgi:hypothetical protein
MDDYARCPSSPSGRNGDLSPILPGGPDLPKCGRAGVAEYRFRSTAEDRGCPKSELSELRPPYRIDAALDTVQPAVREAVLDLLPGEAELEELCPRHYSVLAVDEPPERGAA